MDPLRTYELQSVASGLSLCCDAPGAQSAGSIAHGSTPGARRATVRFLDTGFGVTAGKSENKATSAATGALGMGKPPCTVGALDTAAQTVGWRLAAKLAQIGSPRAAEPAQRAKRRHAAGSMRGLAAQPRVRSPTRRQLCARREQRRSAVQWKAGCGGDAQPNDHALYRWHIA